MAEHQWLIAGALGIGVLSALLAVWPQFTHGASGFPWGQLGWLFGGVAGIAVVCAYVATKVSLRGSQLRALRNE